MDQDIFMKEETYVQGGGFAALVRRYSKPLLAMAYRYTFDWESAKDVCQDTWLRVYEKISVYDGRVPFERWLFAVHRNICISFLRKRKRRGETRLELDIYRSSEPDPERMADLFRARERILQAASRLPERQRMVFAMIDLEQMTIDEAAALIGIKPVSIRTNLFHARKRIAGILQGSEERT
jgi:RNA polymerase sigma-70 factor (ECF subfamily)